MAKKIIITAIVLIITCSVLTFVGIVSFVKPRVQLLKSFGNDISDCKAVEFVEDNQSRFEEAQTLELQHFSLDLPTDYVPYIPKYDYGEEWVYYWDSTATYKCQICDMPRDVTYSLLEEAYYRKNSWIEEIGIKDPEEMLCSIGPERPDSYYNIMKNALLLDTSDYNMLNLDQLVAFYLFRNIREEFFGSYTEGYLYEREEVYAVIFCDDSHQEYTIELINPNDLNMVYMMYIDADDIDSIVKILNSIEFR